MTKMKKMIAAILMMGLVAGCTPLTTATGSVTQAGSDTSSDSITQGGNVTQPEVPPAATVPVDLTIILAEGDDIKVTSGDVEAEFNRMLEAFRAQYGAENVDGSLGMLQGQKASILEQLVRNAIFDLKADELGLQLESAEAQAEYERIVAENTASYGDKEEFEKAVGEIGYTMDEYRMEILKGIRHQALADEVTKDESVTEEEIRASYEETKDEQFSQKPGATIYHIFFGTPDDTTAESTAKEAKAKLDAGAKFGDIALEYGKDGTASTGGLLGSYPYDTKELGADFMAEAAKLTEGQISEPVLTSFGWHIIFVENVQTEAKTFALEDSIPMSDQSTRTVREVIENALLINKKNERMMALQKEWQTEFNVSVYEDLIPMNVIEEEEADGTTPGTGTQGSDTSSGTGQP